MLEYFYMKIVTRTHRINAKKRTLADLEHEIMRLRSSIIGLLGRDMEGEYRPEFVAEILGASTETTTYRYEGPGSLLKQLRKV